MNILKIKIKLLMLLVCFFCTITASAQEDVIRKRFQERVVQGEKITSVKKTPYSGLYEVQVGNKIVYTDSKARYLFIGRMIDIETGRDYTQERMEAINKIRFSDLPLEQAIKKVNGKGERVIAVFSDPNCGYCKRLESMLQGIDNLTIYVFPLNILSEKSRTISRNVWCSPNRTNAWNAWMIDGKLPPEAGSNCSYSDEAILQLARKFDITGTPVIFFRNGSRITGLLSAEDFIEALSAAK
ncbi:MAG: DsbC family protein [Betaproteobacteria bacterium]|nr:DsbC family protein [Betaproteobacteria bacterium]